VTKKTTRRSASKKSGRKKNDSSRDEIVLAYDLGGTKVAVGAVTTRGKVLFEIREPVKISLGKAATLRQLADIGKKILAQYPQIKRVGIASAGPLDPVTGVLLSPTNFKTNGKLWGKVPLAHLISKALRLPVAIDNDAAAAALAEHRFGANPKVANQVILTLGTGLGTGMICNGELVRAGRFLHPEGGHLILNAGDSSAVCGCGNLGCAEAYLSGTGFTRRAQKTLGDPNITAHQIAALAKKRSRSHSALFDDYAHWLAVLIHNLVTVYAPQVIVLTGGFAETHTLFVKKAKKELEKLLKSRRIGIDLFPQIETSALDNRAGLIGAMLVALHSKDSGLFES
jgi:glucokinase